MSSKQANILTQVEEQGSRQIPKLDAHFIGEVLRRKHGDDYFQTQVKTGPTHSPGPGGLQIIDCLAIKRSWANPCFTAYEVKVTRNDFQRDAKWGNYLNYCHQFYWACPSGLIRPDEVEDGCGLLWVNADGGWSVRKAARYRRIKIPDDMLMYIIMSKLEPDRHPFFSSDREFYEAYVQDRKDGLELQYRVSQKWAAHVKRYEERVREAEFKAKQAEREAQLGNHALKVLQEHGVRLGFRFGGDEVNDQDLVKRLETTAPVGLLENVQSAQTFINRAVQQLKPKAAEGVDSECPPGSGF